MKLLSLKALLFIIAPALLFAFTTIPDHANFSSSWKLNEGKSELGQFGRFATKVIKADQKTDSITISRTAPSFNGDDVTTTETLHFDGKQTETPVFGTSKKTSTVKWSDDGQTMIINYTLLLDFNGQTNEIKGSEKWSLSDGGKTLTVSNTASSDQGEFSTKAVYDKQ